MDWVSIRDYHGWKEIFHFSLGETKKHLSNFTCYLWLGTCNCSHIPDRTQVWGTCVNSLLTGNSVIGANVRDIRAQIPEEVWKESGEIILPWCLLPGKAHKLSEIPEKNYQEEQLLDLHTNSNALNYMTKKQYWVWLFQLKRKTLLDEYISVIIFWELNWSRLHDDSFFAAICTFKNHKEKKRLIWLETSEMVEGQIEIRQQI